ncbi:Aste57867_22043 [Aphanomyces stellatus]|uniref:Aste57867_22043 protein n=1 Tax=Aphanomyces stellatus TaxID=120398 RepID=A0A485LJT7_9STRA|nr:hypothetical protein As57867_021974 [Aphanomyces stellatus]VFT98711.1 Aste57867_22043 [Aphanomyces stellatus]
MPREVSFQCPPLTPDEHHAFLAMGQAVREHTLQNALTVQKGRVIRTTTNAKTHRTATIHRGHDVLDPSLPATCAHMTMCATLDQVADFFRLDSSLKVQAYLCTMGETVLDRQTLYTLQDNDDDGTSCSIAWLVHACPWFMADRDTCVLEVHDRIEVVDQHNQLRRGWMRAIHSIDVRGCPPLKAPHGFVRASLVRSGHVFLESDTPGLLQVYSVMVPSSHGAAFNLVRGRMARQQVERILNLEEYMCMNRLLGRLDHITQRIVNAVDMMDAPPAWCAHCTRNFATKTKKQCRDCGAVVCLPCGHEWDLPLREHRARYFICHTCFCDTKSAVAMTHRMTAWTRSSRRRHVGSVTKKRAIMDSYDDVEIMTHVRRGGASDWQLDSIHGAKSSLRTGDVSTEVTFEDDGLPVSPIDSILGQERCFFGAQEHARGSIHLGQHISRMDGSHQSLVDPPQPLIQVSSSHALPTSVFQPPQDDSQFEYTQRESSFDSVHGAYAYESFGPHQAPPHLDGPSVLQRSLHQANATFHRRSDSIDGAYAYETMEKQYKTQRPPRLFDQPHRQPRLSSSAGSDSSDSSYDSAYYYARDHSRGHTTGITHPRVTNDSVVSLHCVSHQPSNHPSHVMHSGLDDTTFARSSFGGYTDTGGSTRV